MKCFAERLSERKILALLLHDDVVDCLTVRAACDEQHRCMGLNSHGVSKLSVIDAAGVKQVEHK